MGLPKSSPRRSQASKANALGNHLETKDEKAANKLASSTEAPTETDQVSTGFIHIKRYNGYSNVTRGEDGLFHCPWEGQNNCKHRPHKQRRAFR
jgi:hypothetical protein